MEDSGLGLMHSCRCCLQRAPDKSLTKPYAHLGKTEIYSEMLKECFKLHLTVSNDGECGICQLCVGRLRDARNFKLQVQLCQAELQVRLLSVLRVKEEPPEVKSELPGGWDDNSSLAVLQEPAAAPPTVSRDATSELPHSEAPVVKSELPDDGYDDANIVLVTSFAALHEDPLLQVVSNDATSRDMSQNDPLVKMEMPDGDDDVGDDNYGDDLPAAPVPLEGHSESMLLASSRTVGQITKPCTVRLERLRLEKKIAKKTYTCDICKKSYNAKNTLIRHIITHVPPYKCGECNMTFKDKKTLRKHVPIVGKSYICEECNRSFGQRKHFNEHLNNIHGVQKITPDGLRAFYACQHCSKEFSCINLYAKHLYPHVGKEPYTCDMCSQTFSVKCVLISHIKTHMDPNSKGYNGKILYKCNDCNSLFKDKWNLNVHKPKGGKYNCDDCYEQFSQLKHYSNHLKDKHSLHKHYTPDEVRVIYSCKNCSKQFSCIHLFANHLRSGTRKKSYNCHMSDQNFDVKCVLFKHIRTHIELKRGSQNNKKLYRCDECNLQFRNKSKFNKHKRLKLYNGKSYHCNECYKQFKRKMCFKKHMKYHYVGKSLRCEECNKQFSRLKYYRQHLQNKHSMQMHNTPDGLGVKYSCKNCSKGYSSINLFAKHLRARNEKETYTCDMCNQGFNVKCVLIRHITAHMDAKRKLCTDKLLYKCEHCNAQFANKTRLRVHKNKTIDGKLYKCEQCNIQFLRKRCYEMHMKIHYGGKSYNCEECNKQFKRVGEFNTHKKRYHNPNPIMTQCEECDKKFYSISTLNKHKTIHTGQKPFECEICHKKFGRKTQLNSHTLTHTGEKPYSCEVCGRKFSHKAHLDTHKRVHSGAKPYLCDKCPKLFAHKHNLDNHRKTCNVKV